jgi:hypothetical protein
MLRFIREGAGLAMLACALFGAQAATASEKSPDARHAEYRGFVVRGAIVNAAALDVLVVDLRGEPLDGAWYELKDGAFEAVIPLPIGVEARIHLKALDHKGELLAEGSGYTSFNDSRNGSTIITLASADADMVGTVLVSPLGLRLDRIETYDPELRRYELRAFDADRREIELPVEEVSWEIPFPEHTRYEPCKPSGTGIVPCIEFRVPIKGRRHFGPEVSACVLNNVCIIQEPPPPDPVNGYQAISAGDKHTCALTNDGRILCWGANGQQQIARVTSETCRLPPPFATALLPCGKSPAEIVCPPGALCRYSALDAGFRHTCAIDTSGAVWCWGDNGSRQLGYSCAAEDRDPNCHATATPRRVAIPGAEGDESPRFVQVSAGHMHTCVVSAAGNVYCWGANSASQLGSHGLSQPRVAASPNKYLRVSAGTEHTCAVTAAGGLDCWGGNDLDRIQPNNPLMFFSTPTEARGFHPGLAGKVSLVAANRFGTCAYADVSGVVCWGVNIPGDRMVSSAATTDLELGFVTPSRVVGQPDEVCSVGNALVNCGMPDSSLMQVQGSASGFTDSTVGGAHYCGVMADSSAFCWGKDNTFGQMGDGSTANSRFPVRVLGP